MKTGHLKIILLIISVLTLIYFVAPIQPVNAANILVTTNVDETTTNDLCSLREAIRNANEKGKTFEDCEAGTGIDTITFDSGISTIFLGNALPQIKENLTIDGGGVLTIDGGGAASVFKVHNQATLTLFRITIANSTSGAVGAGVNNNGVLVVQESRFENNNALGGSAIYTSGDSTTIEDSSFVNNSAQDNGGSLTFASGINILKNSLISGNSANAGGGLSVETGAVLEAENLTFFNNQAIDTIGNGGGGVLVTGGTVTLKNITLESNTSASSGGGIGLTGGLLTLQNSIVANNIGGNCTGTLTDGGGNLVWGDTSCPGVNADPNLLTLGDNGGKTHTMALGANSKAVNLANPTNCPATDQRGFNRRSGYCDSGSYEAQPVNLTAYSGNPQYAVIGYLFNEALVAKVSDNNNNPLGGVTVDYSAPVSGATASLSSTTGTTDTSGTISVTATANMMIGSYNVTASSDPMTPVDFALSNIEVGVISITRVSLNPTNAANVDFKITFNVPVTGVGSDDFILTVGGTISDASVTGVTGSDAIYTILVNTGAGDGTLRLDLIDDDTIIDTIYNRELGGQGLGNGDFTSGEVYTIDKTGPVTIITNGPASLTTSTSANFEFTADEAVSHFECSLDGGVFTICTTPKAYTGLTDGGHTFTVQAQDLAGNLGQPAAAYAWTVDSTKPTALMGPLPASSPVVFTVSWSGSDATSGIASYDVEVKENEGNWSLWQDETTDESAEFNSIFGSTYSFRVQAEDNAGNVSDWSPTVTTEVGSIQYLPLIVK